MTSSEKYGLHVNVREIALKEETRLTLVQKKNSGSCQAALNFAG